MTARRILALLTVIGPSSALVALGACDDGSDKTLDREPRTTNPVPEGGDADAETGAEAGTDADAGATDGPTEADAAPVKGVVAIATGASFHPDPVVGSGDHTCAIGGLTRSLYCWGANEHGQLGTGPVDAGPLPDDLPLPLRLASDEQGLPFDGIDEISAAGYHTCARRSNDLHCWGQRFSGAQAEPPFATNPDRVKPRLIGSFPVARVAAGGPHTCVVRATNKISCFGHSSFGELGRASAAHPACTAPIFYDYAAAPTHTCSGELLEIGSPLTGIQALAAGEVHSCAVVGGKALCWGANDKGQLGAASAAASSVDPLEVVTNPTTKTALPNVLTLSSGGGKHTCALADGKLWCWGANDKGQLGTDPVATPARAHAAAVAGLDAIVAIGVAEGISCVATATNTYCWGADDVGQLGDGETTNKSAPVAVKGAGGLGTLTGVVAIAPGTRHVCALRNDRTVWCWGKNDRGQLGNGTKIDSPYPVKVIGLPE